MGKKLSGRIPFETHMLVDPPLSLEFPVWISEGWGCENKWYRLECIWQLLEWRGFQLDKLTLKGSKNYDSTTNIPSAKKCTHWRTMDFGHKGWGVLFQAYKCVNAQTSEALKEPSLKESSPHLKKMFSYLPQKFSWPYTMRKGGFQSMKLNKIFKKKINVHLLYQIHESTPLSALAVFLLNFIWSDNPILML